MFFLCVPRPNKSISYKLSSHQSSFWRLHFIHYTHRKKITLKHVCCIPNKTLKPHGPQGGLFQGGGSPRLPWAHLIFPGNCWAKSLHLESRSTWQFLRFVGCPWIFRGFPGAGRRFGDLVSGSKTQLQLHSYDISQRNKINGDFAKNPPEMDCWAWTNRDFPWDSIGFDPFLQLKIGQNFPISFEGDTPKSQATSWWLKKCKCCGT